MPQAHDKLIGTVPMRIVEQATIALTTYDGRVAEFNVASWLQLLGHAGLAVSLIATYRDGQQQREAAVDHGRTDGVGKILLSGVARLLVRHKIEDLQLHLPSSECGRYHRRRTLRAPRRARDRGVESHSGLSQPVIHSRSESAGTTCMFSLDCRPD